MLGRILKLFRREALAPLRGVPAVRRQKTYSAQSGYVYQYFYDGYRDGRDTTEYLFEVSADRKTSFPVAVVIPGTAVRAWEAAHGSALRDKERYAVAKVALFQAFDERPSPASMAEPVHVRAADLDLIIENLGIL